VFKLNWIKFHSLVRLVLLSAKECYWTIRRLKFSDCGSAGRSESHTETGIPTSGSLATQCDITDDLNRDRKDYRVPWQVTH